MHRSPPPSPVLSFAERARRFCQFVDQTAGHPDLRELATLLAELHAAALGLPDIDDGPGVEKPTVEPPAWSAPAGFDIYREVFDPFGSTEPVAGSLTDDVRDIYCDLRRGLHLFDDADVPWTAAAWDWRFHHEHHWGNHLVDALRALHHARASP